MSNPAGGVQSMAMTFGPHGGFAQVFPNFEVRPEQTKMAEAVEAALTGKHHLLVEAGTGIGKSLAYLTPAATWALAGRKRVLISTCTKVLQNQLVKKDIPLLQQVLGPEIRAEPVFGQENYLCRRRLNSTISHGLFDTPDEAKAIDAILDWAGSSDGILVNFPDAIDSRTLAKIGRNSDNCLFLKCPLREECCYFAARERWSQAHFLVINHWLFFANSAVDDRLLPHFDAVVFDEAHRLEDVCADGFGIDLSNLSLDRLFNSIHNPRFRRGLLAHYDLAEPVRREVDQLLEECRRESEELFRAIRSRVPAGTSRVRVRESGLTDNVLDRPLGLLASALKDLAKDVDDEDITAEVQSLQRSAELRRAELAALIAFDNANAVYWIEVANPPGGRERIHLRSALIDVAELFKNDVFGKHETVILTSATLTVNRNFRFIVERLGAQDAETLMLDSPFDYSRQTLLFADDALPPPQNSRLFVPAVTRRIDEILHLSQGRALVLFTSYDLLEQVFQLARKEKYHFYRQGEASTFQLLNLFREDVSSVLFATQSFWEGVDIPGESLSCLVITRLPFEVPDDPRLEGIAEALRDQGREPFTEYQLPQAVLRFRQGFGRLIRSATDRGVACVLDNRILTKAYGRVFLNSLPKGMPVIRNVNAIGLFLKRKNDQ